ncbi:hypothetical protein EMCG_04725 [[Emmonsia] crescens]|uniref:Uncharacterized protein n=1 Tax=[Emmonsia] crescens TaxID=73230 RepID=A0A0G2HSB3_9EURO|nr:hypothetical protein EMCG_04725 [Emmonsia crescens UAMH 3008]
MTTFSQEEFEQLLHNFEDNPPDFEDNPLDFEDNSDGFELNFCADIDSLDNELPQPSYFNTTPCPMDASLEVQLAETQNDALEDSMKTMEKLMQLHASFDEKPY